MNLKELSTHLGLSPTTVSRALNGYTDVSAATRQRVAEAAQQMGYQPDGAARRLARGKADAVGIVFPTGSGELGDPRFLEVVGGLTERLEQEGLDLLIMSAAPQREHNTFERLLRMRRVDGFIVPHTRMDDSRIRFLLQAQVPFVAYGRTTLARDHAWFDFDNEAGSRLAVQRLLSRGHRDIAYVHAPPDLTFSHQRRQGFLAAMDEAGCAVSPGRLVEATFSRRGGYHAMQILLQASRPTAVIVDNNLSGVGVVRCLLDAGLVPGRDMAVILYDGEPADSIFDPLHITAIVQPEPHAAGVRMAELMIDALIGSKPVSELQVLWQPRLQPGESDAVMSG